MQVVAKIGRDVKLAKDMILPFCVQSSKVKVTPGEAEQIKLL